MMYTNLSLLSLHFFQFQVLPQLVMLEFIRVNITKVIQSYCDKSILLLVLDTHVMSYYHTKLVHSNVYRHAAYLGTVLPTLF